MQSLRFRLSTLLLLLALVAVSLAWILERRHYTSRLLDEVERESLAGQVVGRTSALNEVFWDLEGYEVYSAQQFKRYRNEHLTTNIVILYARNERTAEFSESRVLEGSALLPKDHDVLEQAAQSLYLLGVESNEEFVDILSKHHLPGSFEGVRVLDDEGRLMPDFRNFLDRAFRF